MEKQIINFMPGPVNIHPDVKKIYHETFQSHRSAKFYTDVAGFRGQICGFVNAPNVAILVGSGSLANETVAQYLGQLPGKGLILINGEFGQRLREQAHYAGLNYTTFETELGSPFDYTKIETLLNTEKFEWLWLVHCETSSGVLNKLELVKQLASKHGTKIAVDCISTIGNVEVNLQGIYLASGTSGKGLSSYPGIALVFFEDALLSSPAKNIPKYMNLKHHCETNWVPYTINTNLFYALVHAFNGVNNSQHREGIKKISQFIYKELKLSGFSFLGRNEDMMPGVISIICPPEINSYELGAELEQNGFYVNYGGAYLRKVNYFQVCIMGHQQEHNAQKLVTFLKLKKEALITQLA